ncbi:hypothetical protein Taro_018389 [Colocasia esculenta]|uniref:Uncharacterized protein n=1 Tax=Colocasia esculenta TaxID=4460 RepID=A0A843UTQ5_COLES|nr:hypothetical protein [Colocasia esculenta]
MNPSASHKPPLSLLPSSSLALLHRPGPGCRGPPQEVEEGATERREGKGGGKETLFVPPPGLFSSVLISCPMALDAHRGHGGGAEPPEEPASAALDEADHMFAQRGCCCFWVPYFGSASPSRAVTRRGGGSWERIGGAAAPSAAPELSPSPGRPWWRRAMMKVREWSEIVAGPRWKTFIRRFKRRQHRPHHHRRTSSGVSLFGGGGTGGPRLGQFHYDPLSYARNFDEGSHGQGGDADGDFVYRNFSARYVLPPSSAKSSMDLGGRDALPLFHAA